jgi:hypothetical protein
MGVEDFLRLCADFAGALEGGFGWGDLDALFLDTFGSDVLESFRLDFCILVPVTLHDV